MTLSTEHLTRCIETLKRSYAMLLASQAESIEYEVARNAVVKSFELCLETSGKYLRRVLRTYVSNPREADMLNFKDVFRHGCKRGLLTSAEVERWFAYRDNRNNTAHDYGVGFAENTVKLIDEFIQDASNLRDRIDDVSARP